MSEAFAAAALTQAEALAFAVLLVLLARVPALRAYGPRVVYPAWGLVPVMVVAALLPHTAASAGMAWVAIGGPSVHALRAEAVQAALPIQGLLLSLWAAGVAVVLGAAVVGEWRLRCAVRRGLPAGSDAMVIGFWRPRVWLPADFERRYDAQERRLVLAHEEVHRGRRDNLWNLLALLLLAVNWFNPLAWLGWRTLRRDQELACDAAVLDAAASPDDRHAYRRALMKSVPGLGPTLLATAWRPTHPFVERIRMLHRSPPTAVRRRAGLGLLALTMTAAAGLAWSAGGTALPADGTPLRVDIVSKIDGQAVGTLQEQLQAGQPLGIQLKPGAPEAVQVALAVAPTPAGAMDFRLDITAGDGAKFHAKPRLIAAAGQEAAVQMSYEGADGTHQLDLHLAARADKTAR
jgi:beta-lactamase regulating signal transducer with metallopeptidase domain